MSSDNASNPALPGANTAIARKVPLRDIANIGQIGPIEKKAKTTLVQGATAKPLKQHVSVFQQQKVQKPLRNAKATTQRKHLFVYKEPECDSVYQAPHLPQGVEDIDFEDFGNPQMVPDIANNIMGYNFALEEPARIPTYFEQRAQRDNHLRMRAILIDWLVEIHYRFELLQETLYLTMNLLDRYLADEPTHKDELQLVGVTAMLVASKYEEMYPPEVGDFVYISDNAYTRDEILAMERKMLRVLNFDLGRPSPLHFLRRFSKAGHADAKMHTIGKYLCELTLCSSTMMKYRASEIAAAATHISREVVGEPQTWTPTLAYYSSYSAEAISSCVLDLKGVLRRSTTSRQKAVTSKFGKRKYLRISKSPEIQSFIQQLQLAAPQQ